MFLTFRKWTLFYLLSLVILVISFAVILWRGESVQASAPTTVPDERPILILDPGHGGEDGGAVAADGTVESHINLAIASSAAELAAFLGWDVRMTRTEDISIHDSEAQTLREKKVSDLKNRVSFCNSIGNGLLISIHQNSLPSAKTVSGAQVFYNNSEESAFFAQTMQEVLNSCLNHAHCKEIKPIGNSSYLMKNVNIPAVLIECGFLSNAEETELLKTHDHQLKLAICILAATGQHLTDSEK